MGGSLKLFKVNGIDVRVHISFLLVMVWAAYLGLTGLQAEDGSVWLRLGFMELFVLLLFTCVVLHELAHALTAQVFGVKVEDITLWPLGGMARMANLPESPFAEFIITAAGPAMSIFLAMALGLVLVIALISNSSLDLILSPFTLLAGIGQLDARNLLLLLVINNAILAVFNLIPAFPLDGGRLLRALLAALLPFATATRIASVVGQLVAVVFLIAALLGQNIFLGFVAVFIFLVAGQERRQVATQNNLRGLQVQHAMQPLGLRLHPLETLGQVATQMTHSSQSFYLVVDAGRLAGVLSRGDVLTGLRRHGPDARVGQQMSREPLRLGPQEPLTAARDRLAESKAWLAVVIDNGQIVGTLSQGDLDRVSDLLGACPALLPRDPSTN